MNKAFKLIILLTLTSQYCFSQERIQLKNDWTYKLLYSNIASSTFEGDEQISKSNFGLDINYNVVQYFEPGVYFKVTLDEFNIDVTHYGFKLNYQILPLFSQLQDTKLACYLCSSIGQYSTGSINWNNWEYGVGLGVGYFITRHFGITSEFSFGDYYYNDNFKFSCGLCYKYLQ